MKQYEFDVRVAIRKTVLVEAKNEERAIKKMDRWDTIDEREQSMEDWEIISGPKEIK